MFRPTDVGRPISDLTSHLQFDHLVAECREVLKTLVPKQIEVRTNDGKWFLMRIVPYRTADNVIDGLVLTYVNIVQLKETEEAVKRATAYFSAVVDTVREPLVVLDPQLRVISANRAFYQTFRTAAKQTEGELIYEIGAGRWNIHKVRELLEEILLKNTKFENFRTELELPEVGHRVFSLNARRIQQTTESGGMILLVLEDVTDK
jgi:two-component system CheB/CheR fusion protein